MMSRASLARTTALAAVVGAGCAHSSPTSTVAPATHSGPIALSPDGSRLYVVHPDADLVTVVDTGSGATVVSITLAATPTLDADGNYYPSVSPRALALDPSGATLFVTGERSGHVYAFDASSGAKLADVQACSEPVGVLVDAAGQNVFVACSQDDLIVELAAKDLSRVASATSPHKPWALAWAADGHTLLSTHLLGWGDAASDHPESSGVSSPGISAFTSSPLAFDATWTVADGPPGGDPTVPHGRVRGVYDAAVRPGTSELWAVHIMLGVDTAQPTLDFQSTVFPAVSILDAKGSAVARLSVSAMPGDGGAFADVVSGPRALAFSPDGEFAFMVDTGSEDVLIIDARQRVEAGLVRPLPGHQPEGAVWGSNGKLYVQERNTEDIAVIDVTEGAAGVTASVEPSVIGKLVTDVMPGNLRFGQHLFNSANSDEYPVTSNHWVSCTSCHIEDRSDAVTWLFTPGPRDTPSNAGGMLVTGFLFRTADRRSVKDYWKTIDVEQGGDYSAEAPSQAPQLEAIMNYVNHAIPFPVPPTADAATMALRAQGATVFRQSRCDNCHSGAFMTDSGQGNASLDLGGPVVESLTPGGVLLHDVGTCVKAPFPDVAHDTLDGYSRAACLFDTPTLRGLSDSAPYLHDGSAATIEDAVDAMLDGARNDASGQDVPSHLSASDKEALVAYLKGL
jgi:DNA-binding beta-propeller fold protein YncE